jgi:hypothetical protein
VDELESLSNDARKLQGDVANEVLRDDGTVTDNVESTDVAEAEDVDAVKTSSAATGGGFGANPDTPQTAAAAPASTPRDADSGPDTDLDMPYGEMAPFGREDTAQELTDSAIRESDKMVDQLEKAQVAETKRAVFRSLTRLRGAAINSFDGIARAQTGNIDEYAHTHKWRDAHPMHHLAAEEADVSTWAFPANADLQVRAEPSTGRRAVSALLAEN